MPSLNAKKRFSKQVTFKVYLPITVLLFTILIIATLFYIHKHPSHTYPHESACDLFSLSDAQKILGEGVTKKTLPESGLHTSDLNYDTTTCFYDHIPDNTPNESSFAYQLGIQKSLSISIADGQDAKGIQDVKKAYGLPKTSGAMNLLGIGDQAYYIPTSGALYVLYGNYNLEVAYYEVPNSTHQEAFNQSLVVQVAHQVITDITH